MNGKARLVFRLDGHELPFVPGQSLLEAALAAGFYIPHLCQDPGQDPELPPHGGCRLCLVSIGGRMQSACTTPAAENLVVDSATEALERIRRILVQMLFIEGHHVCPGCEKSGDCRLQALAYRLGLVDFRFPAFFPRQALDASHPDFLLDRNRCILCALCVRASRQIDGKGVFAIGGRGGASRLLVDSPSGNLGDSRLARGDRAAEVCPVGAILPKHQGYEIPIGQRRYDRLAQESGPGTLAETAAGED